MFTACEILFDATTAARVRSEVRARMGGECPCDSGERCPLLPADLGAALSAAAAPKPRTEVGRVCCWTALAVASWTPIAVKAIALAA